MFVLFLFLISISLAAVAGAFSIFGLVAIYPASAIGVMIGAVIIEICKLATISFLYQFYDIIDAGKKLVATFFIILAMLITSMGVYGYLTKGYIQQIAPMANTEVQIASIESSIERHQFDIDQAVAQLKLMDAATQRYIELGAVSRSVTVNAERDADRQRYNDIINRNQDAIFKLREQKTELSVSIKQLEAEVGPIQYVADLLFKDTQNNRDTALKWFSIIMVLAIDPFAVALLVFANTAYKYRNDPRVHREFGGIFDKQKNSDTIDSSKGDNEQGISVDEMLNKVDAFLREKDEVIDTKVTTTKAQEKPLDKVTIEPESTIVEEIQQTILENTTPNDKVVEEEVVKIDEVPEVQIEKESKDNNKNQQRKGWL